MSIQNRTRLLGLYLLLCAAYQSRSYPGSDFFYLQFHHTNPRLGFSLLFLSGPWFRVAYWTSAAWLLVIAIAMAAMPARRIVLQLYVAIEVAMSFLTILSILFELYMGSLPSASGLDFAEVLKQCAVLSCFSIVPAMVAMMILQDIFFVLKLGASLVLSVLAFPLFAFFMGALHGFASAWFILIVGIIWSLKRHKRVEPISSDSE